LRLLNLKKIEVMKKKVLVLAAVAAMIAGSLALFANEVVPPGLPTDDHELSRNNWCYDAGQEGCCEHQWRTCSHTNFCSGC
jgi:hypothetical protein